MKRLPLAGCALLLSVAPVTLASINQHVETFTTTTFRNQDSTIALWDTGTGELKLPPFVPSILGTYDTPGQAYSVVVAGDYAFVADYLSGLRVLSIAGSTSPTLLGTYDTPGSARGVAVDGDLTFVADEASGLQIIDISSPASPTLAGSYNTPGTANGVAVAGDLVFVADGSAGLQIINISNPASPTLTGSLATSGTAYAVVVAGDYAYVAADGAGLHIVNIANPAAPALAGTYNTAGNARGVRVAGDLAFVADANAGLQIIDIANPAAPTLVGTYNTPGSAATVVVSGDVAYVADHASGLQVIDITNPASPTLIHALDTPGTARGVTAAGDRAYVADDVSGLHVIQVRTAISPVNVGAYDASGWARQVAVDGDLAYVTVGSRLVILNFADPRNPTLVGTYSPLGDPSGVSVAGDLVFVADATSGLRIINVANPAAPVLAGTYDTAGYAHDVFVAGDLAFVADHTAGLQIINISNPASPTLAGSYGAPGYTVGVVVSGDLAFIVGSFTGPSSLFIIDVSNPASPVWVGGYDGQWASDVAVEGDRAILSGGGGTILDVSDPANPSAVASLNAGGWGEALQVELSGNFAFVGSEEYGLVVYDISYPSFPVRRGSCCSASVIDFVLAGDLAFYVTGPAPDAQVMAVFQREAQVDRNFAGSLPVDESSDAIRRVRMTATQTTGVDWKVSATNGAQSQPITPDNTWHKVAGVGSDLVWRATLEWTPDVNPAVSDLQLEWLNEYGRISSVTDIPGDQGRWLRLGFQRSGLDFVDETSTPVSTYGIWRRVDDLALAATVAATPLSSASANDDLEESLRDLPLVTVGDRVFLRASAPAGSAMHADAPAAATGQLPPGTWELVQSVPALQTDNYLAAIPTQIDSSEAGIHYTVLMVTTHTTVPSVWFASAPDSGYSVDNVAPVEPASFSVVYNTGSGNTLSWSASTDPDFMEFRVYRSTGASLAALSPAPVQSTGILVHVTTGTGWVDPDYDGGNVQYQLTAVDFAGNESVSASPGAVTGVNGPRLPQTFALHPNVPNPFNPVTTIRYDVPAPGGAVALRVYDVSGRLVRTLIDGPQAAGQRSVTWNGHDDAGRPVTSGVYFYRLTAPGFTKTHKMMLLK